MFNSNNILVIFEKSKPNVPVTKSRLNIELFLALPSKYLLFKDQKDMTIGKTYQKLSLKYKVK